MKRSLRRRFGRALVPSGSKSLLDAETFTSLQPYKGGWIVTQRGEYMGFVKKLKGGWKIDAHYGATSGRNFEACEFATKLLDARTGGGT